MASHGLHSIWVNMKRRCYEPTHNRYQYYGGKGIQVFEPWLKSFQVFCDWVETNLGPRPIDWSLDRIDGKKDYEPGNLRWANSSTQNSNKSLCNGKSEQDRHIYWSKNLKKWRITMLIKGKRRSFGSFTNLEVARACRDKVVKEYV